MIKEVEGDILLSNAKVIAHGVAPNDNFHQGLALALRENWPAMYKDFRHYCHNFHPKAGTTWSWMGADGQVITSLFAQEAAYDKGSKPGPAHLEFVNHALKAFRKEIEKENYSSIALPKIATGVGGLNWEEVYPMIKTHLKDLKIPVFVYTEYHKGVKAEEGLAEKTV